MLTETQSNHTKESLEAAILILGKPFALRTKSDFEILMRLTEHVKFFQEITKLDPSAHYECCQFLYYTSLQKDEVLFEQGSVGKTFYIILEGSVGVVRTDLKPKSDLFKKKANLRDLEELESSPELQQIYEKVKNEVKVMKTGESFGELALRNKAPRAASIIGKEITHLACLDKDHYDKILYEKKKEEELSYYRNIPFLKNLSKSLLQRLHLQTIAIKLVRNEHAYIEGDPAKDIFFVFNGELKLIKTIDYKEKKLDTSQESFPINDPSELMKSSQKRIIIDLTLLNKGQIFGEDDIHYKRNRFASAICVSAKAEILKISAAEFERRVISLDEYARNCLECQIEDRNVLYKQRIQQVIEMRTKNKNLLSQVQSPKDILSPRRITASPLKATKNSFEPPNKAISTLNILNNDKEGYNTQQSKVDNNIQSNKVGFSPRVSSARLKKQIPYKPDLHIKCYDDIEELMNKPSSTTRHFNTKNLNVDDNFISPRNDIMIFRRREYIKQEEEIFNKLYPNDNLGSNDTIEIKKLKIMDQYIKPNNNEEKKNLRKTKNNKDISLKQFKNIMINSASHQNKTRNIKQNGYSHRNNNNNNNNNNNSNSPSIILPKALQRKELYTNINDSNDDSHNNNKQDYYQYILENNNNSHNDKADSDVNIFINSEYYFSKITANNQQQHHLQNYYQYNMTNNNSNNNNNYRIENISKDYLIDTCTSSNIQDNKPGITTINTIDSPIDPINSPITSIEVPINNTIKNNRKIYSMTPLNKPNNITAPSMSSNLKNLNLARNNIGDIKLTLLKSLKSNTLKKGFDSSQSLLMINESKSKSKFKKNKYIKGNHLQSPNTNNKSSSFIYDPNMANEGVLFCSNAILAQEPIQKLDGEFCYNDQNTQSVPPTANLIAEIDTTDNNRINVNSTIKETMLNSQTYYSNNIMNEPSYAGCRNSSTQPQISTPKIFDIHETKGGNISTSRKSLKTTNLIQISPNKNSFFSQSHFSAKALRKSPTSDKLSKSSFSHIIDSYNNKSKNNNNKEKQLIATKSKHKYKTQLQNLVKID